MLLVEAVEFAALGGGGIVQGGHDGQNHLFAEVAVFEAREKVGHVGDEVAHTTQVDQGALGCLVAGQGNVVGGAAFDAQRVVLGGGAGQGVQAGGGAGLDGGVEGFEPFALFQHPQLQSGVGRAQGGVDEGGIPGVQTGVLFEGPGFPGSDFEVVLLCFV